MAQKPAAKWQQGEVNRWLGWLGLQQAEPHFKGLDGKASPTGHNAVEKQAAASVCEVTPQTYNGRTRLGLQAVLRLEASDVETFTSLPPADRALLLTAVDELREREVQPRLSVPFSPQLQCTPHTPASTFPHSGMHAGRGEQGRQGDAPLLRPRPLPGRQPAAHPQRRRLPGNESQPTGGSRARHTLNTHAGNPLSWGFRAGGGRVGGPAHSQQLHRRRVPGRPAAA